MVYTKLKTWANLANPPAEKQILSWQQNISFEALDAHQSDPAQPYDVGSSMEAKQAYAYKLLRTITQTIMPVFLLSDFSLFRNSKVWKLLQKGWTWKARKKKVRIST